MNERPHSLNELKSVLKGVKFDAGCPNCHGQCCHMPWLAQEEVHSSDGFAAAIEFIGETPFLSGDKRCAFLNREGRCSIYELRPLDCRLFPLDIIEENGDYYWCIYTICPNWSTMKSMLEPLIPLLEERMSLSLWRQFLKQLTVTKEEYSPYKNGQYVTLKKFVLPQA